MQLSKEREYSSSGKSRLLYISALLMVIGVISRLPFQSRILHHWDSVNFALALDHFDVRLHQPHPPGTFVLYILSGRFFNLFIDDGNRSLVWVSMIATGFAAAAIFLLASSWADRRQAIVVSLLMLTSPLVWFQGEVALSYMLEFFWSLLIVYACLRAKRVSRGWLFVSALLIGLAGGIRPNTPFFLFPLWLFVLAGGVRAKAYSAKHAIIAFGLIAVGVSIWAIPMISMSGGMAAYFETLNWWREQHTESSATAQDFILRIIRIAVFMSYALGAALLPVVIVLLKDWRRLKEKILCDWRAQALCVWILPGLAYYIFIHVQQSGHIFTIMPAVILLAGFSVVRSGHLLSRYNRHALVIVTSIVVASNALFFLFGPADIFGASRVTLIPPTRAAIQDYDGFVSARLDAIRRSFSADDTVVIAGSRNFRIPDYYLQEYQNPSLSHTLGEEFITLPNHIHALVFFDDEAARQISSVSKPETLVLPDGNSLRYISWSYNQSAKLNRSSLIISESGLR